MKVYLAGSTKEMDRVRDLSWLLAGHGKHEILADWLNLPQDGTAGSERFIWRTCLQQIREADVVIGIVPKNPKHKLNGGVLEIGYALGRGTPVVLWDEANNQSGSWKYAEGITRVVALADLLVEINC